MGWLTRFDKSVFEYPCGNGVTMSVNFKTMAVTINGKPAPLAIRRLASGVWENQAADSFRLGAMREFVATDSFLSELRFVESKKTWGNSARFSWDACS
jgi:hypothetical protein